MTTATEQADIEYQRTRLTRAFESFVERWQPEDRHESAQFAGELHHLMTMVHRDAAEPFVKMLGALPLMPMVVPK